MRNVKRSAVRKKIRFISVAVIVVTAIDVVLSNAVIVKKSYSVRLPSDASVRIAFAADTHIGDGCISWERTADKIEKQHPDIICLAGDIIGGDGGDITAATENTLAFLRRLAKCAPVYFSLGNHELDIIQTEDGKLKEKIEECGVTVLDDSFCDITVNNYTFRIGGMLDDVYHFYYTREAFAASPRADFLRRFNDTELYTLMLCHRPDSYFNYENYGVKIADLILSGHVHGGVVRVPFGKAVYVPDMGWFPELSYGFVAMPKSDIIITSGTAAHGSLPRFNNPCEICMIEMKGAS